MRAIGLTQYGAAEVLRLMDLPPEPLGPGLVRIRVKAATVNPTDTLLREGLKGDNPEPVGGVDVPGMEIAGVVAEIGSDVTNRVIGEHVMGIVVPCGAHGAYRENVVLPARSITGTPAGTSDVAAATLPMNGLTARQALDVLELQPGQVLAVTGAAGALGGYVIQLAKHEGLTVVADASPSDEALVRDLGADLVVARGVDVAARIREAYPDGVDGLVDAAALFEHALPAVRDAGVVATVRGYAGDGQRDVRVTPLVVRRYATEWEKLDQIRALAERGVLTPRVAKTYPVEQAVEAHRALAAGGTRGRLVLTFD